MNTPFKRWGWFENNREPIYNRLIYTLFVFYGIPEHMVGKFGKKEVKVPVQKYRFIYIDLDIYKKNNANLAESQRIDPFYQVWMLN